MTPLQSQCCSWWWVGGVLLKSTIISTVLNVLSSKLLRLHQTASSLTSCLSRLVTVLDDAGSGVVCKLQELDRGVFRCAVVHVEREEQWGENTALRSSSADGVGAVWEFSQPHLLLSVCQEAGDPLTDGGGDGELCQFIQSWSLQTGSSLKFLVCPDAAGLSAITCWLHHPQTCLLCRQTAGVQQGSSAVLQVGQNFQMISWPQTLEPQVCIH